MPLFLLNPLTWLKSSSLSGNDDDSTFFIFSGSFCQFLDVLQQGAGVTGSGDPLQGEKGAWLFNNWDSNPWGQGWEGTNTLW